MPRPQRPNVDPSAIFDAIAAYVEAVRGPGVQARVVRVKLSEGPPLQLLIPPGWRPPVPPWAWAWRRCRPRAAGPR